MDTTTLERQALKSFDDLLEREELFWKDTPPQVIKSSPFDVSKHLPPRIERAKLIT